MDRVHRIGRCYQACVSDFSLNLCFAHFPRQGQKRPVRVIRFLMEDSIETRSKSSTWHFYSLQFWMNPVAALQESKLALGKGSLHKLDPEEQRKARIMTLHQLLQVEDINQLWDSH